MLDNYATHKHAKVRQWLAARPRFHLDFTPTYASWLNQVERWFGLLSQRAIKRGSFRSVADLVRKIQAFIDSDNASATPFAWVATAQSIIDKVARIAMRMSGTPHLVWHLCGVSQIYGINVLAPAANRLRGAVRQAKGGVLGAADLYRVARAPMYAMHLRDTTLAGRPSRKGNP